MAKKPTKPKEEKFTVVNFNEDLILKFTKSELFNYIHNQELEGYDIKDLRILNCKHEVFEVEEQPAQYKLVKLKEE